jgi:hypothetical protein
MGVDGFGTFFLRLQEEVVKASSGHVPPPFLISGNKRTAAKLGK